MTLLTIIASIITGIVVGGWLAMVAASAAISRSQQHMEKRVRYWQARAREAHAADQAELQPAAPDYWPQALADR
jgi:MFS superfamily sulfate permease-like transporter